MAYVYNHHESLSSDSNDNSSLSFIRTLTHTRLDPKSSFTNNSTLVVINVFDSFGSKRVFSDSIDMEASSYESSFDDFFSEGFVACSLCGRYKLLSSCSDPIGGKGS